MLNYKNDNKKLGSYKRISRKLKSYSKSFLWKIVVTNDNGADPLSITETFNNCYSKMSVKLSSKIANSSVNFDGYFRKCSSVEYENP